MFTYRVSLGTWLGIKVYLDLTWFLFAILFFIAGWQSGLLFLSLFFIILLHEYGHCLAGRHYGYETIDVTLTLLGGLARMNMPVRPKHELVVALAGPAVNVLFMPILFGLSYFSKFFDNLGYLNLVLLLFNLVPALPLDGGRALRAILCYFWNDRYKATVVSARISQGFCVVFVILSIFLCNPVLGIVAVFLFLETAKEIKMGRAALSSFSKNP